MGRPKDEPKTDHRKTSIRLSAVTQREIHELTQVLGVNQTEVLARAVHLLAERECPLETRLPPSV